MNSKWPDPGDSALDRARAIARSYRSFLLEVAPEKCSVLDAAARELGEHWIAPRQETIAPGELVTTEHAAEVMGVSPATIRSWGARSWVPVTHYRGGWDLDELRAYKASQRMRRRIREQSR